MKHWTEFLTEAGTISKYGKDISILQSKIIQLEKELQARKIEVKHEEEKILERAQMEWTIEEIEEAKKKVNEEGQPHPIFQQILKSWMP